MGGQYRKPARVDELNQMQMYLGEETIEDYQEGLLTRRSMLRRLIAICGGSAAAAALMSACGVPANAPPTVVATSMPTSAPEASPTTIATAEPTSTALAAAASIKAALSVAADDPAVAVSDVTYDSAAKINAYLAKPAKDGAYPGVIVIHENRGLTDHIKDVARRLAKAGYIALAPDLVSRFGGTASMSSDKVAGALGQAKPDDLLNDLNSGVDFLSKTAGVKPDKIGVVGFCFGGGYTLRLAVANAKIAAAVSYYATASQMASTNAAILGQYGATDQRVNGTIPGMEKVLKDAGKTFEKYTYDGAGHAFNNDTGAAYNEAAAVQAWPRTLDWFAKYLT